MACAAACIAVYVAPTRFRKEAAVAATKGELERDQGADGVRAEAELVICFGRPVRRPEQSQREKRDDDEGKRKAAKNDRLTD